MPTASSCSPVACSDNDQIDSYIELKMTEVVKFEQTPHPVEYEMYYSA
ncbi:hypothetical protein N8D56_18285 [Devosia sp. A8/3-2]|nr:hypothetical protein N8D56_18285 [Devosia sp. A8/3-2]